MAIAGKLYRIKSRTRFTMFIAITIVALVMITNTILGINNASSMTQQEFLEVQVQSGDTLWHIASQHMPEHQDIRKSVHMISSLNGISADELRPGQILLVPIEEE